ncbi:hypothetical protein QFZ75_001913 [Streptomyces sp. V3I8]|nr:hypothetical protein [Streptomyces sp. V3I8]MDQ1035497.1 hypothetical protein [Streptomyces sp. V3I8]
MSTVTRQIGRGRRTALGLFIGSLVLTGASLVAAVVLYATH